MDYSKLSDVEINHAVASVLPGRYITYPDHVMNSETEEDFDPCNNPADAWPIISENNISIILDNPSMPCATANARDLFDDADPIVSVVYGKPLRAAMIVFLMKQESANVPANPA